MAFKYPPTLVSSPLYWTLFDALLAVGRHEAQWASFLAMKVVNRMYSETESLFQNPLVHESSSANKRLSARSEVDSESQTLAVRNVSRSFFAEIVELFRWRLLSIQPLNLSTTTLQRLRPPPCVFQVPIPITIQKREDCMEWLSRHIYKFFIFCVKILAFSFSFRKILNPLSRFHVDSKQLFERKGCDMVFKN